jgi:hypothetical protein
MEAVVGQLINYIEKYKNGTGQADGKTKNIDQGVSPVSPKVPYGDKYIVF